MFRTLFAVIFSVTLLTSAALAQDATVPAADPATPVAVDPADAAAPAAEEAAPAPARGSGIWIIDHLKAGGRTVVVLLALSVLGLGVAIERFVHLRKATVVPSSLAEKADKLWKAGQFDELHKLADKDGSVLSQVIATIVRHRRLSAEQVSVLAGDVASREMRRHLQKCYGIAIVATLSPLLGLFGTVVGMIQAFDVVALAGSMGDPSLLADSISVALITTEVGLAIAIPALFVYHLLKGRASVLGTMLEETASDLITEWKIESGATHA